MNPYRWVAPIEDHGVQVAVDVDRGHPPRSPPCAGPSRPNRTRSPSWAPEAWGGISATGIAVTIAAPRYQEHSGLTRAVLRGGRFQPVRALGDPAATALASGSRTFCCAHGDLDMLGHRHGPGSLPWRLQLRRVDQLAAPIAPSGCRPTPSWR
jgi:hypothetical protein